MCSQDPRGLSYEPYSLTPLAHSLTSLQLCGTNSLSLLLSVTDCTNIQTLVLRHIAGAAGTPEMMVQLVCSLPVLQELHLCHIEAPQLQRVSWGGVAARLMVQPYEALSWHEVGGLFTSQTSALA